MACSSGAPHPSLILFIYMIPLDPDQAAKSGHVFTVSDPSRETRPRGKEAP